MEKNAASEDSFQLDENGDETQMSNETKLHQPDTYWSWIVCAAGVASNMIILGSAYCFGIVFPSLLDEFKEGKSNTAWIGSLAMGSLGFFGPLSGRLTDRFGARAVVVCGALMSAAGLILTSLVPSLYLMLLTYGGIFGFGSSLVYIAVYEIVPRYFVKRRSLATGLLTMSMGAAMVVMSPLWRALIDTFGWRGAFRGIGCISLSVVFIGWALNPKVATVETEKSCERSGKTQGWKSMNILDFSMWRNATFTVLNITFCLLWLGHTIPPVHLARYCADLGMDADLVTWLYSCIGLTSVVARILGSMLCDVMGSHRVILGFGTVSAAAVSVLLPLATNWTWLFCFSIAYGLADGTMAIASVLSILQTLTQKQKAQGFGFFQLCICVAFCCGPPIGGLVAEKANSYHAAFLFTGGIEVLALLILLTFICVRRGDKSLQTLQTDSDNSTLEQLLVIEMVTVL